MGKIVVVAAQKGGVAKTTTVWAMTAGLTNLGYKVLAVDFDPQGNLSFNANINTQNIPTVYDVIKGSAIESAIVHCCQGDILPADRVLSTLDFSQTGREYKLKKILLPIKDDYDFILIDTPPELSDLSINAFTCADYLIPLATAGAFSANGLMDLKLSVNAVMEYCNPTLSIVGVLLVKYNARTNIGKTMRDITAAYAQELGTSMFQTYIRNATVVEETQALRTDLFSYAPQATVTQDYTAFIKEFLEKIKVEVK